MIQEQALAAALAVEKQMYRALSEALDLTREILDSLGRQDEVSVRLNLSLRQETIDQLCVCRESLQRQAASLSPPEGAALRRLLNGEPADAGQPAAQILARQVEHTRELWERVIQADQAVSRRLGGERSFYRRRK